MICPQCQAENIEGSAFCDNCGSSLANIASSAAPVSSAPPPTPSAPPAVPTPPPPPTQDVDVPPTPAPIVPAVASTLPANPPAPPPSAMPPPSASDKIKCTFCGNENEVGSAFCENCGSPLAAPTPSVPAPLPQPPAVPPPPPPATPVSQSVPPAAPSQMIIPTPASQPAPTGHPRIVVVSNGMNFDLSGYQDILIGRVDPTVNHFPQVDLTAHGGDEAGVSRKHLRITFAGNQYFAEDLESSNGSWIGTNRLTPNTRTELNSGDQLRLGKLVLNFYAQ